MIKQIKKLLYTNLIFKNFAKLYYFQICSFGSGF